jgi:hypothetical protein
VARVLESNDGAKRTPSSRVRAVRQAARDPELAEAASFESLGLSRARTGGRSSQRMSSEQLDGRRAGRHDGRTVSAAFQRAAAC